MVLILNKYMISSFFQPVIAILTLSCLTLFSEMAVISNISILFMLLFPFFDSKWKRISLSIERRNLRNWSLLIFAIFILSFIYDLKLHAILATVILISVPEEWFFRAYFMQRVAAISGSKWIGNLIASGFFAFLHLPQQSWIGLGVFIPSLAFGWIYQKTNDLVLVILLHTLSNLFYITILRKYLF